MSVFNATNLREACRSCMETAANMKPLISVMEGDSRTLLDVLSFVTGIQITEEEDLPNQICEDCILNIRIADCLKTKCEETQDILVTSLAKTKNFPKTENEIFCEKCQIQFKSTFKFMNHEQCHENPYQCSICLTKYSKLEMLVSHLTLNHNNKENQVHKYECNNCEQTFTRDNKDVFESHLQYCRENKFFLNNELPSAEEDTYENVYNDYKIEFDDSNIDISIPKTLKLKTKTLNKTQLCVKCLKRFDTKKDLKQHLKEIHPKESKETKTKKFKSKKVKTANAELDTPLKKDETAAEIKTEEFDVKLEKGNESNETTSKTNSKNTAKKVPYNCILCDEKFSTKHTYGRHMKAHEAKNKAFFMCSICKREFIHKAHLEKHMLSNHVSEGSFKCSYCSLNFATQDVLDIHVNTHKELKKHNCEFCNKGFNMLSTLKDHVRTHTGEKPYLCATCGRGFSQKTNLKEHMRRHVGFKPFPCSSCDKKFVSKGELQAHLRKHTGAHPFVCSDCDAKFTTSSSLVKHRRIHTGERPYICEHCSMGFSTLGSLKNHRRTHTGEKPYKCMFCEKAFAQRNDMTTHIRCHTGERPYVCQTCGQAFKQSSALKTHQKLHAPKDGAGEPVQLMMKKKFYYAMEATTSISPDIASCASIPENST